MSDPPHENPAWQARKLLRSARVGTLATVAEGQPFASLVTPACAPDLSILLWLSALAEHTRQLRREPRCALLVAGTPEAANPQTAPRLTVTGLAEVVEDGRLKARWLATHPYASLYADFADFALWRMTPRGALLIGGFARAHRLRMGGFLPDPAAAAAIQAAEASILARCNADHQDALARLATAAGTEGSGWRMVTVDVDGFDLGREDRTVRIDWPFPVERPSDVERQLLLLARRAPPR